MPPVKPKDLPVVCAWCHRVRDPLDQRWQPADPRPAAPGTAPNQWICPECHSAVTREARRQPAGGSAA
jgi:hypothetical protein